MKYTFDGNWNKKLELSSFNQLLFENDNSFIEIIIRDFLDDEIEPFQEQINTINFIIENQEKIVHKLLDKIWLSWQEIYTDYSIADYNEFPEIKDKQDLKNIIGIRTIYIHPLHKDGYSYYGLEGNCMWDEEHGLGFVIHKERIIEFGGAEEADAGGRESNDNPDNTRPNQPIIPKLYKAHPIFKSYKPAHKQANVDYPHILIERHLNNEFQEYLKFNSNVDFIHPEDWQKRTYLKTACMCNNEEIFEILIGTATNFSNAIYSSHKRKNIKFLEKLIEKGANIHETHHGTSILSDAVEQHLRTIASNLTEEQMDANQQRMINYYNKPGVNKHSPIVKEITMHPRDWIERSRKYIKYLIQHKIELDDQKINYVKHGNRNNPDAITAIEKEEKWIKNNYE